MGLKKFIPRDSLNSPLIYILFSMAVNDPDISSHIVARVKRYSRFSSLMSLPWFQTKTQICVFTFRRIKSRQRFNFIIKRPVARLRQPCPYPFHFLHPYTSYCCRNSHFHFDKKLQAAIIL